MAVFGKEHNFLFASSDKKTLFKRGLLVKERASTGANSFVDREGSKIERARISFPENESIHC